jgi:DNA gyrase subunit B
MFVGNTRDAGLRNLVDALLRSSFESVERGHGRFVRVHLQTDGLIQIADDGPVSQSWMRVVDSNVVETTLEPPGWKELETGRTWLWYSVALALADRFRVDFRGSEACYRQEYQRGELARGIERVESLPFEFAVSFLPDPTIFEVLRVGEEFLLERLQQLAFLHSGIRAELIDPQGRETVFHYEDGIRSYVEHLSSARSPLHPDVMLVRGESEGIRYEIGLQWTRGQQQTELSFVNDENVAFGGRHITGLHAALSRSINSFIRQCLPGIRPLDGKEIREGLVSILSLRMNEPIFASGTRTVLHNEESRRAIQSAVGSYLRGYLQEHPEVGEQIVLSRDSCLAPLHPVVFDPAWRTSTVVALARQMYDSRDFALMPILGDALQDAGCEHAEVLAHCRGASPHVRGCWVVDLVLGKE